jgi:Ca2+-binding EF-hand superfamily protein
MEQTTFGEAQVLELHDEFNRLKDPGHIPEAISKKNFVEMTKILNNEWSEKYAEKIFNAIEKKNRDYIELEEFVRYLDILYNAKKEKKLTFTFRVMDQKNQGFIQYGDFFELIETLLNIQSSISGEQPPSDYYINNLTSYVMNKFDSNQDRRVDLAEFVSGSKEQEDLCDLFQLINGTSIKGKLLKSKREEEEKMIVERVLQIQAEIKDIIAQCIDAEEAALEDNSQILGTPLKKE